MMRRVLWLVLLAVCAVGEAQAAEIFHFPISGVQPPTAAATRVNITGQNVAGKDPSTNFSKQNWYEIRYADAVNSCFDFKGTVMGDYSPKRCGIGASEGKPCTVDGDCGGDTCIGNTLHVRLYGLAVWKLCDGGTNAGYECDNDADCPSSTCSDDSTLGTKFTAAVKCVPQGSPYKAVTMPTPGTPQASQELTLSTHSTSANGNLEVVTGTTEDDGSSCAIGDEYILRLCRIGGEVSDGVPGPQSVIAVQVSM